MLCKLCQEERELCNESHIIPNFLYKELFDDKHRIFRLSTDSPRIDNVSNGEYEGGILCFDCDNRVLGGFESYASMVFHGGVRGISSQNFRKPDGLEFSRLGGIDYKKFKLFLLSLLWKASISSRPFFQHVSLGAYEEKIRRMLLNGDPGKANAYPCVISSYRKRDLPNEIIADPKKITTDGTLSFSFLVSGMLLVYKITENEQTDWVLEAAIKESGEMLIPHIPRDRAMGLLNRYFNKKMFT